MILGLAFSLAFGKPRLKSVLGRFRLKPPVTLTLVCMRKSVPTDALGVVRVHP